MYRYSEGVVTAYDPKALKFGGLYRVRYEDGDVEEYNAEELAGILV